MFLPVLLVRDYGLWGWIAFAVPNVVGAAAMGWVLPDAAASAAFAKRHAVACRMFSFVTIAYHVFFAMWMIQRLSGLAWAAMIAFVVTSLAPGGRRVRWTGALAALAVSCVMFVLLRAQQSDLLTVPSTHIPAGPAWKVAALVPTFILGFGLCPYLDLTFHRARQGTSPAGGRLAFGVGFGVVFLAMIGFTLLYARWVAPAARGVDLNKLSTFFLCLHLIAQSAFTVGAHVHELHAHAWSMDPDARRATTLSGIALLFAALAVGWFSNAERLVVRGRDFGEVVYWCFLGFYGVVFPGYLVLGASARGRRLLVLALVIAAVVPMYWMGFVEMRTAWLPAGVLTLLAGRVLTLGASPRAR
jgi:hypothetical protein